MQDDLKPHNYKKGQAVDLIIADCTDLGFKAIINQNHWGVLYRDEVFQPLEVGQNIQGFIKHIRPDGKIDLTLQGGQETRDKNAQTIVTYLENQGGFAPLHDKSDPLTITELLGMSKGAFKKAVGNLYRQRVISIAEDGIRLLQKPEQDIIKLSREPVELYKILKFEGLVGSGGEARNCVANGQVLVNGKVETQKRKKIMSGDVITFGGKTLLMQLENHDDQ